MRRLTDNVAKLVGGDGAVIRGEKLVRGRKQERPTCLGVRGEAEQKHFARFAADTKPAATIPNGAGRRTPSTKNIHMQVGK